ncbi:MAG: DUF4268 domain-containing protein [Betaproteobacteria bacterium]|nr:DUF4268 domain-containing protein [Betaproteobacteria bacterium]
MTLKLGQLKNLKLKSVWNHEEHDFTPWLAEESHLSALSDAIGMDLQLDRIEVPVGPYVADILAKDASGEYVVIENQFGKTNHDHLGKLLTYGATLGVSAVVWIAEQFTEEHRKTVEWLNERTNDSLSLYAVQLEVLQIDDSPPAIRFNVISQPNQVVRAATAAKSSGSLTETQQMQLEFWKMFRHRLLEKKVIPSAQTARPQYWFDVALGRANIFLSNILDTYASRIGVRVYVGNRIAEAALAQLEKDKVAIEQEIGEKLVWNPTPEKRDKIIGLFRKVDLSNRDAWPEYCDWLVDFDGKFRKAFVPRIKALKLAEVAASQE